MMANEITEKERQINQLGLPPMELAESSNEQSPGCLHRCIFPALQKIFIIISLITISASTYVLVLTLLDSTGNNTHSTEIIVLTGLRDTPNITLHKKDMDIFFQLSNYSHSNVRQKRSVFLQEENNNVLDHLSKEEIAKVKGIVLKHQALCHEKSHEETCTELIRKLNTIINRSAAESSKEMTSNHVKSYENINRYHYDNVPTNVTEHDMKSRPKPRIGRTPNLTESCLLAKLIKQSYPDAKEIYDPSTLENASPIFDQPHSPNMRYFHPSVPLYTQNREMESHNRIQHPQDFNILMNFFQSVQRPDNNKSSQLECASTAVPCNNNEQCVGVKQWCDGNVDCSDASDEIGCSCKSRVDKSRLCDGYFDCPFGEDEMGCFGCSENTFSCKSSDINSENKCFSTQQRCDGVGDCSNNKDESECNMLAPSLNEKPLFAISNTEGYLHRNLRGDWYAVCENPYMWAHDACRQETGLMIRSPIIKLVPIDPLYKVKYLNTGPGGFVQASDTCFDSSAVYVTCPAFLCGTRVHTTSQSLLHENEVVENQIFGRNKRFLIPSYNFNPYHWYYGSRKKREIGVNSVGRQTKASLDKRNKRAEARVVGGKPSQPTAWPWMVAIYRDGSFLCGGVIITHSWVVSAAHCVHRFWEHYYEIQVGMLRRLSFSPQEHNHRVTHIIVNHHYNKEDMKGDLSLLKVEHDILFSRWVRPICLPGPNTAGPDWVSGPALNTICTAVGWGATMEHGPDPDHMREVEVPIWENCKHREDRAGNEICAGFFEGGKDACQGDSGGPLLCRNPLNSKQWYLAGIVSHGDGCARKNEPGVYTRVSLFVKWIKYHTSSKSLPRVQPKQNCPGFKCKFGVTKCLPDTRKCDKIVDCLDAQDEIHCNFMRSSNDVTKTNLFNVTMEKLEKTSTDINLKTISTENTNTLRDENETSNNIEDDILTSTEVVANADEANSVTKSHESADNEPSQNSLPHHKTLNKTPDFQHASTIESSPTNSIEYFSDMQNESQTFDPTTVTTEETSETTPIEFHTLAVSFQQQTLESRSSIAKNVKLDENTEKRSTRTSDIEDISPIVESTTTLPSLLFSPLKEIQKDPSTTTKINRGDSIPDEETVTESDTNIQTVIGENESDPLIIELLPNNNATSILQPEKPQDYETSLEDGSIVTNGNTSTESISPKNLPDIEDKSELIHKIEDIVFSELQPANIRRKHLVPKEFECRRIFQIMSYSQRCDRKVDCEDGTDEFDCACTDYLSTFDEKLICDGVFDCADGQDEIDCFSCPEDHVLCKRSEMCIPLKYVCDGSPQCPMGEDELNCFALTNGREMEYDIDEKPKINLEGFLTKRNQNDWHVVCEESFSIGQQEQSATQICHYLGFSFANRYLVKHINVNDEDIVQLVHNENQRRKRGATVPVHFAFLTNSNETARNIVIREPQVLKEECVPNVTKTCKSLYVYCARSLFTNFDTSQDLLLSRSAEEINDVTSHMWPWIAKVFIEGEYKCTGILIDLTWVLVSDSCLWDGLPSQNFISVILGSHRTLHSTNGFYEQILKVDAKKYIDKSRVILLHLNKSAEYSNMVKPMKISSSNFYTENSTVCLAIGQDTNNNTISIFVNESNRKCHPSNRCFERLGKERVCKNGVETNRPWSGIISCHNEQGWYPAASFVESRGECGLVDHIVGTDIEQSIHGIKYYSGKELISDTKKEDDNDMCEGVRCSRGRCVSLRDLCDGVNNCEDGNDETENSCKIKKLLCQEDPYHRGCACSLGEMKCRNGKCISKRLFKDGKDDCGDETDEPKKSSCSDYLARVMPSRLCDGVVHCEDRSDEDPMFCKCFSKKVFRCDKSSKSEQCVAPDMVCDGVRDCANGEDERNCIGLSAPDGTAYGKGQVILCSHGVWYSKCYPTQNHTKSELEAICRELGFISGHAKEIKDMKLANSHNKLLLEPFSKLILNNNTVIKMRNGYGPVAIPIYDENLKNCHPVFIECL